MFSNDVQIAGTFKAGIQVRKSKDLINWKWVDRALPGVPESAYDWTGVGGLWTPDIVKFGDTNYIYYSASQFGKINHLLVLLQVNILRTLGKTKEKLLRQNKVMVSMRLT